jgi:hypothetical protein
MLPFSFSAPKPRALLVLAGSAVAPFNAQATWWHAPAPSLTGTAPGE